MVLGVGGETMRVWVWFLGQNLGPLRGFEGDP